eukprot:1158165-Pelagomonas_calceolata.AAC.2
MLTVCSFTLHSPCPLSSALHVCQGASCVPSFQGPVWIAGCLAFVLKLLPWFLDHGWQAGREQTSVQAARRCGIHGVASVENGGMVGGGACCLRPACNNGKVSATSHQPACQLLDNASLNIAGLLAKNF